MSPGVYQQSDIIWQFLWYATMFNFFLFVAIHFADFLKFWYAYTNSPSLESSHYPVCQLPKIPKWPGLCEHWLYIGGNRSALFMCCTIMMSLQWHCHDITFAWRLKLKQWCLVTSRNNKWRVKVTGWHCKKLGCLRWTQCDEIISNWWK